jgi:hypothetical protein
MQQSQTNLHRHSQFIDPENPAPEIYDLMLNQKCPEWQNGYPDTMQKLKLIGIPCAAKAKFLYFSSATIPPHSQPHPQDLAIHF